MQLQLEFIELLDNGNLAQTGIVGGGNLVELGGL